MSTNKELAQMVNNTISETGVKKTFISEKLGVSRQALDNMLTKKNFSIDDANKILSLIGYEIEISIKKSWINSTKTVDKLLKLWYNKYIVKGSKQNEKGLITNFHRFSISPNSQSSFRSLIHSIIIISLEKSMKKSQTFEPWKLNKI